MDSAVDSAIGSTNGIIAFRKWNENTSDVDLPIFEISSDDMPSMISTSIQVELKNAIKELEELTKDISQDPLFKYLEKSIDPFWNSIGKRSTGKYVREYYDILELDKQLNLLNFKDVVLTFSPRFAQYLSEKDCYIMNLFLGATGITDKSKENEDEKFWNLKKVYFAKYGFQAYAKTALFVAELLKEFGFMILKTKKLLVCF